MSKFNIGAADAFVKQVLGRTGLGESAFANRNTVKMKAPNPYRYAEAYAFLKADEYKAAAEASQLALFYVQRKAMGEADSEILKKVKNKGTDLWRKVKELLGKLIILVEEFFRGFFDKTKKLETMREKLVKQHSDLDHIQNNINDYTLDEDFKVELPNQHTTGYFATSSKDLLDHIEVDISAADTKLSGMAVARFWMKSIKTSLKSKDLKKNFNQLKGAAKSLRKNGYDSNNTYIDETKLSKSAQDAGLGGLLKTGIALENQIPELRKVERELSREKNYNQLKTFEFTESNKSSMLKEVMDDISTIVDVINKDVMKLKDTVADSKEIKLILNKIKNAPTSVTGSLDSATLGIIRSVCTRTSTGLNITRKIANISAAKQLIIAGDIFKNVNKIINKFEDERDTSDNLIKGRNSRSK